MALLAPRFLPHLLSWASPSNKIIAGLTPSWHLIFRRSRLICLNKFILTGRLTGPGQETNSRLCVGFIIGRSHQHTCFLLRTVRCPVSYCFFPPFPSGCGSFLLVPAEGFDLLYAVCGRTHRGKCVMDISSEFPSIELPVTLPTTQGYAFESPLHEQVQSLW